MKTRNDYDYNDNNNDTDGNRNRMTTTMIILNDDKNHKIMIRMILMIRMEP